MSGLSPITTTKLIRILTRLGFERVHQKDSHAFFEHSDGRTTVVPVHKGEDVSKGLLSDIMYFLTPREVNIAIIAMAPHVRMGISSSHPEA